MQISFIQRREAAKQELATVVPTRSFWPVDGFKSLKMRGIGRGASPEPKWPEVNTKVPTQDFSHNIV